MITNSTFQRATVRGALLLASLCVLCSAHSACGATLTVTSSADDGSPGTLRATIAAAAAGDTVQFALPDPAVITLNGTTLRLTKSVTISGPGATALTVRQGANMFGGVEAMLVADAGLTIAVSGLTLTQVLAPAVQGIGLGGGAEGSLTVSDMVFRAFNTAASFASPTLVERSTFDGNYFSIQTGSPGVTLTLRDSAITRGTGYGIVVYDGSVAVVNSTIAATDRAVVLGAGRALSLTHATIAGNRVGLDYPSAQPGAASFRFKNSLLANNAEGNCTSAAAAIATSAGHNFDADGSCGLAGTGEQRGTPDAPLDARLGALASNGGTTPSLAPALDSAALNAVPPADCADLGDLPVVADQRGRPRPSGVACDIGSVELQYVLDIDRNLSGAPYTALTDGVLIVRYLAGLTGPALTAGALVPSAARGDPVAVKHYLDAIAPQLDIDGNGVLSPAVDGVLILRYLLGLRGAALIAGVIDSGASPPPTRTSAQDVQAYLDTLTPGR